MNRAEMLARLNAGEDPLELSIEKWQDIVDGKGKNLGILNCALCEVYIDTCRRCPVFKTSRKIECHNTPFMQFITASLPIEQEKYAKDELEFLQSLRKDLGLKGIPMEKVTEK